MHLGGTFDLSSKRPAFIECGCNVHGRRNFTKVLDARDARAALPLDSWMNRYEVEERATLGRPPAPRPSSQPTPAEVLG